MNEPVENFGEGNSLFVHIDVFWKTCDFSCFDYFLQR